MTVQQQSTVTKFPNIHTASMKPVHYDLLWASQYFLVLHSGANIMARHDPPAILPNPLDIGNHVVLIHESTNKNEHLRVEHLIIHNYF